MSFADREALLTDWVQRYSDSLLRICFVSLSDWALAEDALQETFIKAWQAMPRYEKRPITNEKAWLCRIAFNVCHDIRRSKWMRHVDASTTLESLPPARFAVIPEDRELLLDICSLPEKYRQVIILYYYQRLSMREAGEILGLDASTVYNRLKKAEALLKRKLMEEVDEP